MDHEFAGKTIVVTGATGGIGTAVVERLASVSASMILVDRDEGALVSLRDSLEERFEGSFDVVGCDFLDEDSIESALTRFSYKCKPIVGLVNVAGITSDALFHLAGRESIEKTLTVNFIAPVLFAQTISRIMIRQKSPGSIVNVSSVTGIEPNFGQLSYGASKAALIHATLTMSVELGVHGIRANAVAPGVIETPMTLGLPPEALAKLRQKPHLGRFGQPHEVASVINWLLSSKASYVTGQTLRVDGSV